MAFRLYGQQARGVGAFNYPLLKKYQTGTLSHYPISAQISICNEQWCLDTFSSLSPAYQPCDWGTAVSADWFRTGYDVVIGSRFFNVLIVVLSHYYEEISHLEKRF